MGLCMEALSFWVSYGLLILHAASSLRAVDVKEGQDQHVKQVHYLLPVVKPTMIGILLASWPIGCYSYNCACKHVVGLPVKSSVSSTHF